MKETKPLIILGIDPGYGKCGYAILEKTLHHTPYTIHHTPHPIRLIKCDCIETDKNKDLPERLSEIYHFLENLIKQYQPQELAIESLFFFKNQKTALSVAQARGAIIVCAKNYNLEVFEYTPLQVKQAIVGYGRGDKEQIQKMIKLHLRGQKTPLQDDTADAVAVGLTHLQTKNSYKVVRFKV
jgi:crossover junction endodeoxyribonuclease RuvC